MHIVDLRTLLLSGTALGLSAMPAFAEKAPSGTEEEIVVTALRRDTRVETTPMSIAAISGRTLANANTNDITSLKSVPGLSFVDGGAAGVRLVVRGVQTVGEPTVGLYYDETPVTGAVGATNDAGGSMPALKLFDVDHVEVLRGPQGTLYGSSAMSGALKVIYNKPVNSFAAAIEGTANTVEGGGSGGAVQGMVNVPLIDHRLAVRAVLFEETKAGYIDNAILNAKDVGEETASGGRVLFRLTPSDSITIDAAAYYQETHGDRPMWNLGAGEYKATNQVRLPTDQIFTTYNVTGRWELEHVVATGVLSFTNRKIGSANGDPSYYFQSLKNHAPTCSRLRAGGGVCTNDQQTALNTYIDGYVHSVVFAAQKNRTTTSEFRLSSKEGGRLNWTVGAFYSDRTGRNANMQLATDPANGDILSPPVVQTARLIDDELTQTAAFADATYAVTPRLQVSIGTRYFEYKRTVGGNTVVPLDLVNARVNPYTVVKSTDSNWLSKINIAYTVSPNLMVYSEASQGYRPGGVNQVLGLPAELGPYRSDSLWNYEIGVKSRFLDNRVSLNVDVYRIDWSDMQVTGQSSAGPFSFISNAGAAEIEGAEVEFAVRPKAGLVVRANAGYTDARLSEDQLNTYITANGRKGDRIPLVPKVTASAEIEYGWNLSADLRGLARLDVTHVGESFSELRPTSVYYRRVPAYTAVNGRIGAENVGEGWGAFLYVNNLFDEVGLVSAQANAISTGQTLVTSIAPRTIGVNLRKSF